MARIKHIAIRTTDPEKTSAFYQEVFGLKKVGLGVNGIFLSDGYINLAILKCRPERERGAGKIGIEHFGFQVDDVEATLAKLGQHGGTSLGTRVDVTPTDAVRSTKEGPSRVVHVAHDRRTVPELRIRGTG
ncbi:MAG: VOC family protein [Deltaproteobacteria bacterium]|nr:MAG: VOC family protein [Deltaproteobacteria bacterium]